jgi:glucoamylase
LVTISNRPKGENICPANEMVSPDALALVRFGLRAADDPRILNTLKVIDATLKFDNPLGPVWYRYNGDGYGEHVDGSPFNGTGIGRPWPLLTGERAHYEIAAGNFKYAEELLKTFENYANESGLFPEQIWDAEDIPELGLFTGKPSGAAMPLVWAHSEYIKLCRSLKAKQIFDMPHQTRDRYVIEKKVSNIVIWNFKTHYKYIPKGKILRIECLAPATIQWSSDKWETKHDISTLDSGLGIHFADLATSKLNHEQHIDFTFYWYDSKTWEGEEYMLAIEKDRSAQLLIETKARKKPERDKIKVFLPS